MTPERHAKARDIFLETVSRPTNQRSAYLVEECGSDAALRKEVELLLAHHADDSAPADAHGADVVAEPRSDHAAREGVVRTTPEPPARLELIAGQMISGRYRIENKLGEGGMGVIYRAQDLVLEQPVAIKFLAVPAAEQAAYLKRLRREVRLALRVSHPNVCRVFDIGDSEGRAYFTMEFCDGEDLARLIRRVGRISQEKGCEIARQLCSGLAAAHGAGVLHRDLKPANILLDEKGKVLITDFGIAAAIDAAGIRETAGTPGYMAPEQVIGVGVDERSDIYSLGLVMYELFSGQPAFVATTVTGYLKSQLKGEPEPISEIVPGINSDIESLINRCISKERDKRPSSALAVASALPGVDALAVAMEARQTASPSLVGQSTALATRLRRPGLWAAAAVIGCLLLPVVRGWTGFPWDARESSPPPVLLDVARSAVRAMNPDGQLRHSAYGFCDRNRAGHLMEQFVGPLPTGYAIGPRRSLFFWYRESAVPLIPITVETLIFGPGHATAIDPSFAGSNQVLVLLDDRGQLLEFARKEWEAELPTADLALPAMIAAAQLKDVVSQPVELSWGQPSAKRACQSRKANLADATPCLVVDCELRESLFVSFLMEQKRVAVDSLNPLSSQLRTKIVRDSMRFLFVVATLLAIPLAMGNLRHARSDIHGATHLFTFFFVANAGGWLLRASHGDKIDTVIGLTSVALLRALALAAIVMILYLALEPRARRYWPHLMIVWTRWLQSHRISTVFWNHVLAGIAVGCWLLILFGANFAINRHWLRVPTEPLFTQQIAQRIVGLGSTLSGICTSAWMAVSEGLIYMALLVGVRWIVGRPGIAIMLMGLFLFAIGFPRGPSISLLTVVAEILGAGLILWVMVRFGLLALVVLLFVADVLHSTPMTLRPENWFFPMSAVALSVVAAIALYAYFQTRRGATHPTLGTGSLIPQGTGL